VKILVPVDKSHMDGAIIPYVAQLGKRLRASVMILNVVSQLRSFMPGAVKEAQCYVELVAQGLRESGLRAEPFYAQGECAEMILGVAAEARADMIVMGTHGRRGMGKLMLGSVAEVVVSSSAIPVLLVRIPDDAANGHSHRKFAQSA
jgi:nucleotide-binding universal stress UspA family protein